VTVLQEKSFIFTAFFPSVAAYGTVPAVTSVSLFEVWTLIQLFIIRCQCLLFFPHLFCTLLTIRLAPVCISCEWQWSSFCGWKPFIFYRLNAFMTKDCYPSAQTSSRNLVHHICGSSLSGSRVLTAFHAVVIRDTLFEHLSGRSLLPPNFQFTTT
jgi:hypothetical protein